MEFITWWFDTHYIASTLLTPGATVIWCMYEDLFLRGMLAFLFIVKIRPPGTK